MLRLSSGIVKVCEIREGGRLETDWAPVITIPDFPSLELTALLLTTHMVPFTVPLTL